MAQAVQRSSRDRTGSCPECDGVARREEQQLICQECGLVIDEDRLDRGPEWTSSRLKRPDEADERRVGAPLTLSRHDRGLSTEFYGERDARGKQISGDRRAQLKRMQMWHRRIKISSAGGRYQAEGMSEIARMGSALGFGRDRREQAGLLFRRAHDADLLLGRSTEGLAAACLYAVARVHALGINLGEIEAVARVTRSHVETCYRTLNEELEIPAPPPSPETHVQRIAAELPTVSTEASLEAERLASRYAEELPYKAPSPVGVAAGAIWVVSQERDLVLTQRDCAEAADVCTMTVRERAREIREYWEGDDGE